MGKRRKVGRKSLVDNVVGLLKPKQTTKGGINCVLCTLRVLAPSLDAELGGVHRREPDPGRLQARLSVNNRRVSPRSIQGSRPELMNPVTTLFYSAIAYRTYRKTTKIKEN